MLREVVLRQGCMALTAPQASMGLCHEVPTCMFCMKDRWVFRVLRRA